MDNQTPIEKTSPSSSSNANYLKRKHTLRKEKNDIHDDDRFLYPNGSRRMSIYAPKFLYGPRKQEQNKEEPGKDKDEDKQQSEKTVAPDDVKVAPNTVTSNKKKEAFQSGEIKGHLLQ